MTASPLFLRWFEPNAHAFTARLLDNLADGETVAAMLAKGLFSFDECLTPGRWGQTVLYRWAGEVLCHKAYQTDWQGPAWPLTPEGSWDGIAPSTDQGWTNNAHLESLFGHIVAHLPDGAGRLRFTRGTNGDVLGGGSEAALLSVAVCHGWWRAAQQLLARADAVPRAALGRLQSSRENKVSRIDAHGAHERTELFLPLLSAAADADDLRTMNLLLGAGADPNVADGHGLRAVHRVCSTQALGLLLAHGARLDGPHGGCGDLTAWWDATMHTDYTVPLKARLRAHFLHRGIASCAGGAGPAPRARL